MRAIRTGLSLVMALVLVCSCALAEGFLTNPDAIEQAIRSVLYLEVYDARGRVLSTGSGFLAFDGQTVVTNQHVIDGGVTIQATDEREMTFAVDKVLASDARRDLAILSLRRDTGLPPLQLAEAPELKRGQPVLAIGSPKGLRNTVSNGIISLVYTRGELPDIQFTAPISSGSSGGALFDSNGTVIGVTSESYTDGQNLNLAVSSPHVYALYAQVQAGEQDVVLPSPQPGVTAFSAYAEVFDDALYIDWPDIDFASQYRVYRAQGSDTLPDSPHAAGKLSHLNDRRVAPGLVYTYRVDALDAQGTLIAQSLPVTAAAFLPGSTLPPATPGVLVTATPPPAALYPIDFGDDGYVGTFSEPALNPLITHTGGNAVIDSFTLAFYAADSQGTPLPLTGTDDAYYIQSYDVLLRPGQSTYPGHTAIPASGAARVYVAITRITQSDGLVYELPEDEWDFFYWEMD